MKEQAYLDAKKIVEERYPSSEAAILAGSVVRDEATATSDLDLVIFDFSITDSFRESFFSLNWPVEAFVHNRTSYRHFFDEDCKKGIPSLPRMIVEGMPLKGSEHINNVKEEAANRLAEGPESWDTETIQLKRYFITDTAEDLKGAIHRAEAIFIANLLADQLHEFYLRTNQQWIGKGKWVIRALKRYDEEYAKHFTRAFDQFYRTGEMDEVEKLVELTLKPYGGPLFDGFSVGKPSDFR
ncbi:nucleotidyltransferase domain-containing protein [Pontibacillus yanchengensis]|uniref:Nucleotidyltransferase n=1 Tax=Pontibacillus yanchengensis Y32 TaxID=1385514 RepID=A0A0A2T721_9BACI|nr:nucleotidyltransferase domain-containing protein [Pontibacillus yanchengensis]KGP71612.1 nucleotidyltransferase [Pontibacillus yanchengensis Y32]